MGGIATRQMAVLDLLEAGECLTTRQMTDTLSQDRRVVAAACGQLVTRGLIERKAIGCFIITEEGRQSRARGEILTSGPQGPLTQKRARSRHKETATDRMWRAMRISQKFTLAEIEMLSGASHDNAMRYARVLAKIGVLMPLRPEPGSAPTSNGFKRWRLASDLGPKTPVYQVGKRVVFDPNSGTSFEVPK